MSIRAIQLNVSKTTLPQSKKKKNIPQFNFLINLVS